MQAGRPIPPLRLLTSAEIQAPPSPTSTPVPGAAAFFFELGSPASYLAAERIERAFGQVCWVPTARPRRACATDPLAIAKQLTPIRREAEALRLPLVVPEHFGEELVLALRVAAFAASQGEGARFALASFRLAFCGGYDLDTRAVLAEAARAAGLNVHESLHAAGDPRWDDQLVRTARELAALHVHSSPAIRIGANWFHGLHAVREAASFCALSALREAARAKMS